MGRPRSHRGLAFQSMRKCPDYACVCNDFLHCALLSLLARLLLWEVIDQQIPPLSFFVSSLFFICFLSSYVVP